MFGFYGLPPGTLLYGAVNHAGQQLVRTVAPRVVVERKTSIPKVARKRASCPDCGCAGNAHFAGCLALLPEGDAP